MKETIERKKVSCYHCGDICREEHLQYDEKDFCCSGCKTVYEILKENDLCTYYDLDSTPGISLKSRDYKDKYAYLDNEEIARMLIHFSDGDRNRVLFYIPAIHCSSCIWLLENLYKLHDGIEHSRVNFTRREIAIEYIPGKISLRQLVELLTTVGYEPYISLENEGKKKQLTHNRSLYIKIGIAGFCFGNIMLLSFPEYFGFEGIKETFIQHFITYLNLLLSLPVVFYCATDYYRSAINGLRQHFINIDVPIALGIVALFLWSLYEILIAHGPGYLDSLAGLLFFMLVGRWFQSHTYDGLSFDRDYKAYFPLAIAKKKGDAWENVPVKTLATGDIIRVRNQEVIPADGRLLSSSASIDYSFVTGESEPVAKNTGDYLYAGGQQKGAAIEIEVVRPVSQSYLTQLWNNEVFSKEDDSHLQSLVNKISRYFTPIILIIATTSLVFWWQQDIRTAIRVFSAVLIVACPCALALSTPFTLGNVMRVFGKLGLYLKKASVVERMARVNHVVFDKTGTLTMASSAQLEYSGKPLSALTKQWIAALASQSTHPVSVKICRYLDVNIEKIALSQYQEIPGKGISARIDGNLVKLGSADFVASKKNEPVAAAGKTASVQIAVNGEELGSFSIKSHYRDGLQDVLQGMAKKMELSMLTGDNEAEAETLKAIFPDGARLRFRQQPGDKLNYIRNLQQEGYTVMMVGDGLNDAGALKQSDVGISVSEKSSHFTPASEAIIDSRVFHKLTQLVNFSHTARTIVITSFIISFLYNVVGLSFAVTGNLSPLFAAVLMPLSSITVVAFATAAVSVSATLKRLI